MRPNDWKMKAIGLRRRAIRSRSFICVTSSPATATLPLVGRSRPPMIFRSEVLPEPDRPHMVTAPADRERDLAEGVHGRVPTAERPRHPADRHQ